MVNLNEIRERMPFLKDYPNMTLYIATYGADDLIPIPWVAADINSAEKIYKRCIEENKNWRTLLSYGSSEEEGVLI